MKLAKVKLENFRGYQLPIELEIDDLTVLIGKNDAGKSTWLEALSIFFEEGTIKIDKSDLNIKSEGNAFTITASFIPPESMIIDSTNPVSLKDEYLLDEEDLITIKKVYSSGKLSKIYLIAFHPEQENLKDLLTKKITDLKSLAGELNIDEKTIEGNKAKSATWRNAIREKIGEFELSTQEILISEKETKEIWDPIKNNLPVYGLFQVDRKNHDQDEEVQDPFKTAMSEILKSEDVIKAIEDLKNKVETAYNQIAKNTIEELCKINPKIANQLHPNFGEPNIKSAFKPEINTDIGVPLNKRGSGIRRLVLLSFFKAEVMRRKKEEVTTNVIYAIEEPETSQHPEHQKMLIESLLEVSKENSAQVIFTTHSPQLVKALDYKTLRYVNMIDNAPWITYGEGVLVAAKNELGEIPKIDAGYLLCVEGPTDEMFFRNIALLDVFKSIIDVGKISILPMYGGFIRKWAEKRYLADTDVQEIHIYDKDSNEQYKTTAETVNSWEGCVAHLTRMKEIENYIHPDLINEEFGTDLALSDDWKDKDIPRICSQKSGKDEKAVKQIICDKLARKMTEEQFEEMQTLEEIKLWFVSIKKASEN